MKLQIKEIIQYFEYDKIKKNDDQNIFSLNVPKLIN